MLCPLFLATIFIVSFEVLISTISIISTEFLQNRHINLFLFELIAEVVKFQQIFGLSWNFLEYNCPVQLFILPAIDICRQFAIWKMVNDGSFNCVPKTYDRIHSYILLFLEDKMIAFSDVEHTEFITIIVHCEPFWIIASMILIRNLESCNVVSSNFQQI